MPPKKLRKSPKLDRVDLVADIESAYGKAFCTDIEPSEQSLANRRKGADMMINRDLNNLNTSSQYHS